MIFTLSTMMFTQSTMMFTLLPLFMAFTFVASSSDCRFDKEKYDKELQAIKAKIALLDQHVYFLATFVASTPRVPVGTVVFDRVLANTGNAYNPRSGIFTAPRAGLYAFMVQTFTNGRGDAQWDLYVNGQMVLRGRSVTTYDTGNNYVFPVIVKSGDRVSVYSRGDINIWGNNHSVMAGWLIKAL